VAGSGLATALTSFAANAAVDTSGYKALVCVFLRGGMDAHDVLIPTDTAGYNQYASVRSSILPAYGGARDRSQLLSLSGTSFGLPPEFTRLQSLYDAGDLAVVSNVGPLIQPTDRTSYINNSVPLPRALFSHNDQQSTWSTFETEGAQFGWGGFFGDAVIGAGANTLPSFTAISFAGNDVYLSGQQTFQYPIRASGGVQTINEITNPSFLGSAGGNAAARDLIVEHLRAGGFDSPNLFEDDIATATQTAVDVNATYSAAFASAPALGGFPANPLGTQLRSVARTIAIRGALGASRQIFLTSMGGFDTHSNQAPALTMRFAQIDSALDAFHTAMQSLGISNDVTLFTMSDFGRTMAPNGDGTDHGWGGHHFVLGGAVNGQQVYGAIPPPTVDHSQAILDGRLIPVTSVDQYAATLGGWFGLDAPALNTALPGLVNFGAPPAFL
jgi:uncharacterized protein (DUF1501 family)